MSNTSLAQLFLEEFDTAEAGGDWIVVYDFIGKKPNPKFWKNLTKMKNTSTIRTIQYSVLSAGQQRDARAAASLAEHYGAETLTYRVLSA